MIWLLLLVSFVVGFVGFSSGYAIGFKAGRRRFAVDAFNQFILRKSKIRK